MDDISVMGFGSWFMLFLLFALALLFKLGYDWLKKKLENWGLW